MAVTRRDFIKLTGTAVVATCIGAIGTSGCTAGGKSDTPSAPAGSIRLKDDRVVVELSEVEVLKEIGGAAKFTLYDGEDRELKIIVVHPRDGEYLAFANRCTHKGKELNYLDNEGKLTCSGLRSQFDLTGSVIKQPAEDRLQQYDVETEGNKLIIKI